jgi:ribosome recycling factor
MDLDETLLDTEERMEKAVEHFSRELDTVRTGRANPALVEGLKVDYYGTKTDLRELCALSIPEPRLIVIRPYDPNALGDVEKAIQKSDLGIAPMNDGKLIRLVIPPLTEESRKQLATRVREMSQDAKTAVRNIRRDANKAIDSAQKDGGIPEDDAYKTKDDVQNLVKEYEAKIDELVEKKTEEIMEV